MQFVLRSVGVSWELARRLGPYLMLEILLPGGTLLALLLFLYRRRQSDGATGARSNALANWVSGSLRVLRGSSPRRRRGAFSHRDFRNSMIAC
jgi:hypothetical protein